MAFVSTQPCLIVYSLTKLRGHVDFWGANFAQFQALLIKALPCRLSNLSQEETTQSKIAWIEPSGQHEFGFFTRYAQEIHYFQCLIYGKAKLTAAKTCNKHQHALVNG